MISKARILLAEICVVSIISGAQGEIVTYDFAGVLDVVEDPEGVLDSSVLVGAAFTGQVWYDTDAAIDILGDPSQAEWHISDGGISAAFGAMTFAAPGLGAIVIDQSYLDKYSFLNWGFSSNGIDDLNMSARLLDYSGTAIDSDALPIGPIHLSAFPDMRRFELVENLPGMRIEGEITSITFIPEPSAGLCLFGLAAPLVRRRSRGNM